MGQDLSFIEISLDRVLDIEREKLFYYLEENLEGSEMLIKELQAGETKNGTWSFPPNSENKKVKKDSYEVVKIQVWAFTGTPNESKPTEKDVSGRFHQLETFESFAGFTEPTLYVEKGDFDYLEFAVTDEDNPPVPNTPLSYAGSSGGGIWKIFVEIDRKNNSFNIFDIKLAGTFCGEWGSPPNVIEGHGPQSIYGVAYQAIQEIPNWD